MKYTKTFNSGRLGALKSAEQIVPVIMKLINPSSVVDVGCGTGSFESVFEKYGVKKYLGIDGPWIRKELLKIPQKNFKTRDLTKSLNIPGRFDLVVCLEVAEHLLESRSESFIKDLTKLGSIILFSAAIPFQGGVSHVNEQWPSYWTKLFLKQGFKCVDILRKKLWDNDDVEPQYKQNILLFANKRALNENSEMMCWFKRTDPAMLNVIHPDIYLPRAKGWHKITKYFVGINDLRKRFLK